jgi:hypothetical protein
MHLPLHEAGAAPSADARREAALRSGIHIVAVGPAPASGGAGSAGDAAGEGGSEADRGPLAGAAHALAARQWQAKAQTRSLLTIPKAATLSRARRASRQG